jgi:hypothetical protein
VRPREERKKERKKEKKKERRRTERERREISFQHFLPPIRPLGKVSRNLVLGLETSVENKGVSP